MIAPTAVRSTNSRALFVRAETIFERCILKRGNVWLPNGKDKVLSVRKEHVGDNNRWYLEAHYRANVFDTATKQARFVDLHRGNMLIVRQ